MKTLSMSDLWEKEGLNVSNVARAHRRSVNVSGNYLKTWFEQKPGWECEITLPKMKEVYGAARQATIEPATSNRGLLSCAICNSKSMDCGCDKR